MAIDVALQQEWESAEIHRSGIEARLTDDASLTADESNIRRYMNPPLDTPFPLEFAYALLGDVRGRTVLDFGCGSGENSLLLARRGARVIGVDISASLIERAERRLQLNGVEGAAKFVVGSAHDLPVVSGSVDVVFGIAILHHLDPRATSRRSTGLKPGGSGIFRNPRDCGLSAPFANAFLPGAGHLAVRASADKSGTAAVQLAVCLVNDSCVLVAFRQRRSSDCASPALSDAGVPVRSQAAGAYAGTDCLLRHTRLQGHEVDPPDAAFRASDGTA